jgi:hypothetical protein
MKRLALFSALFALASPGRAEKIQMSLDDVFDLANPEKWDVQIERQLPLRFADVMVRPKGSETFSLKLWFRCDTPDLAALDTPAKRKHAVEQMVKPYLGVIVEKAPQITEIVVKGRIGYLARITDASLVNREKPKDGEFLYLYKGSIRLTDDSALGFSLMTNDPDSDETKAVFAYIYSFARSKKT